MSSSCQFILNDIVGSYIDGHVRRNNTRCYGIECTTSQGQGILLLPSLLGRLSTVFKLIKRMI